MTNNDKRADEICARFNGMTFSDSDEPLEWLRGQITEALYAAHADGYKQGVLHANEDTYDSGYAHGYREGAEKMREDAAKSVEPTIERPCDCDFCDCRDGDDWARVVDWDTSHHSAKDIRNLPITPPQPAAEVEDDYTTCPECGGDADNGWSREVPPSAYVCSECESSVDDERAMREAFGADLHYYDNEFPE